MKVQELIVKVRLYYSVFVKLIRGHRRVTFINELCKCDRPLARRRFYQLYDSQNVPFMLMSEEV